MKCSQCNRNVDCNCLLENGLCGTCRSQNRRINSGETNNYCEQTLENLQNIIQELKTKEQSKLVEYQVTIVNSQIRMFHKSPCKFKLFIDNIIL